MTQFEQIELKKKTSQISYETVKEKYLSIPSKNQIYKFYTALSYIYIYKSLEYAFNQWWLYNIKSVQSLWKTIKFEKSVLTIIPQNYLD